MSIKLLDTIPKNYNKFRLSVSKAKTFNTCKAKYKYLYLDRLPKKDHGYLSFGKLLHETLEMFHKEIIKGYDGPENILMKNSFLKALQAWAPKMEKEAIAECFEILKQYLLKRYSSSENPRVLAVEKLFNIEIDDTFLLSGAIDVINKDLDDILFVGDYKSSKSYQFLKKDPEQLQVYSYALFLENPEMEIINSAYIMLKFAFKEIPFAFSRDEAMEIEDRFRHYYYDMQNEKLFRANPGILCEYCDYLDKCLDGQDKMRQLKRDKPRFGEIDLW